MFYVGIKKKLCKQAKIKGYSALSDWIKSITNHLYYSVSYTSDRLTRKAVFLSLLNHVTNIHIHDDQLFPVCLHSTVNRKWIRAGKVSKQLNNFQQTSTLWKRCEINFWLILIPREHNIDFQNLRTWNRKSPALFLFLHPFHIN